MCLFFLISPLVSLCFLICNLDRIAICVCFSVLNFTPHFHFIFVAVEKRVYEDKKSQTNSYVQTFLVYYRIFVFNLVSKLLQRLFLILYIALVRSRVKYSIAFASEWLAANSNTASSRISHVIPHLIY